MTHHKKNILLSQHNKLVILRLQYHYFMIVRMSGYSETSQLVIIEYLLCLLCVYVSESFVTVLRTPTSYNSVRV